MISIMLMARGCLLSLLSLEKLDFGQRLRHAIGCCAPLGRSAAVLNLALPCFLDQASMG